jgi:hypothetical protein
MSEIADANKRFRRLALEIKDNHLVKHLIGASGIPPLVVVLIWSTGRRLISPPSSTAGAGWKAQPVLFWITTWVGVNSS